MTTVSSGLAEGDMGTCHKATSLYIHTSNGISKLCDNNADKDRILCLCGILRFKTFTNYAYTIAMRLSSQKVMPKLYHEYLNNGPNLSFTKIKCPACHFNGNIHR